MHETDASVHEPDNDPELGAPPPEVGDTSPDPEAAADAGLAGFEADFDTVDAALEALDADDLDGAESLVASLTTDLVEHAADAVDESPAPDGAQPPSAPASPAG